MYAVVMDSKLHSNAITSPLQDKDLSQHSTPLSDVSVFHAAPTNVFFFFFYVTLSKLFPSCTLDLLVEYNQYKGYHKLFFIVVLTQDKH